MDNVDVHLAVIEIRRKNVESSIYFFLSKTMPLSFSRLRFCLASLNSLNVLSNNTQDNETCKHVEWFMSHEDEFGSDNERKSFSEIWYHYLNSSKIVPIIH